MLNEWFYSHGNLEVAFVLCAVMTAIALGGLFVFTRLVNWEAREHDTSMIGLSYALAGAVYAVVLAFVAVGVFETMSSSSETATAEANSLSSLLFDSAGLQAKPAAELRKNVSDYIDIVTKQEWPSQQAYHTDESNFAKGWAQVQKISLELGSLDPKTLGQATDKLELLGDVNDLFSARRTRLLAAQAHLPDAVWQMLICGLVVILIYVYLFGPHSYRVHMAVTALTVISVGLVFTLIIALDYPFRGGLSVDDEAFISVQTTAERIFAMGSK
jgi:Protein of unknown function (DUF4239)